MWDVNLGGSYDPAEAYPDKSQADKGQTDQGQEPEQTPEANAMDVPAVEAAAAQPAAEADPEISELSAETQADRPVEHPAQDAAEALASAPEPIAPDTVEAVETAVDAPSETLAPTLVEATLAETKLAPVASPALPHGTPVISSRPSATGAAISSAGFRNISVADPKGREMSAIAFERSLDLDYD